jgi:hypothetical protein
MDKRPVYIASGSSHSIVCCCINKFKFMFVYNYIDDGEVFSWGEGRNGALGVQSLMDQF